jgi:hypothetical protein
MGETMTDLYGPEITLMQKIRDKWAPVIAAAAHTTTVGEPFLAALIAGESAGDPAAKRFEPAVFGHILEVLASKRAAFSVPGINRPLGAVDFMGYIMKAPAAFLQQLGQVVDLATSFGLTQIMGWHAVELYQEDMLAKIKTDPQAQLELTIQLLVIFANKYDLNLANEWEAMFTCWNTGEPDGHTYDPNYVANGLRRIEIYKTITAPPVPGVTQ